MLFKLYIESHLSISFQLAIRIFSFDVIVSEKKNRENALNNEVHITANPEPTKGPPTISPKKAPDNVIMDDSALSWRRSSPRPNSQSFSKYLF